MLTKFFYTKKQLNIYAMDRGYDNKHQLTDNSKTTNKTAVYSCSAK